jgi:hypothetical protein
VQKIPEIRANLTDFGGTFPVVGSQFIAPKLLLMTVAHMNSHMSTPEFVNHFCLADHGSGHTRNSDSR